MAPVPRSTAAGAVAGALLVSAALTAGGNGRPNPFGPEFRDGRRQPGEPPLFVADENQQVESLEARWRMVDSPRGRQVARHHAGDAVVVDGVMFIVSGAGNIFAIDAATGAIKWKHETTLGGTYRGVAVGDGKVFSGRRDNTLIALDQKTGALVWKTALADPARGTTSAPAVYHDGLVYIGVGGGEGGVRGQFGAYDAKTGKEVWKFWTLPGPGERGHETWEGDSWKYGGGPVWTHPAIDPDLGMVYVADRQRESRQRWHRARRRQSVHRVGRRARSQDRRLQMALPGSAPRHLGLRQRGGAGPRRRPLSRIAPQDADAHRQDRFHVCARSHQRQAAHRHRGAGGSAGTADEDGADAAVPDRRFVRADLSRSRAACRRGCQSTCIFGTYWTEPVVMAPGTLGGISWAPMTYQPADASDLHPRHHHQFRLHAPAPGMGRRDAAVQAARRRGRVLPPAGRAARGHADGDGSDDQQDRLAEAHEVSARDRQRIV